MSPATTRADLETRSRSTTVRRGRPSHFSSYLKAATAYLFLDPASTLRLLVSLRIPGKRAHDQVKRDALLGDAYALTRDFESADERLNSGLEGASLLGDDNLVARVGYHLVRRHLLEENAERARAALELARRGRSPESRIYALNSETMRVFEERLYDQAERLTELLRQLDPNELEFFRVQSSTTMRLAVLARGLYLPDAVAEIERHLDGLAWPKDFATDRFITHQALAWAKAHQGDYFNAFRHLKRASELVHNTAWKVFAACDSAFLARHFGRVGVGLASSWMRRSSWQAKSIGTGH